MEDFIGIIVLIIYLFAAASSKKKKAQKKRQKSRSSREGDFARAFDKQMQTAANKPSSSKNADHAANPAECDTERIHLHQVTQQQMRIADEGEDPCHKGGASMQEDASDQPLFSYDEQEAEKNTFAQDVLRGVIMSEILTRPCERTALRRNEWSKG